MYYSGRKSVRATLGTKRVCECAEGIGRGGVEKRKWVIGGHEVSKG
jgi:hypothetical protein